jgi:outer membrane autotransporter protein
MASGSSLGVTVGQAGHTLVNVAGTASFGTGSKIVVTLDHVGSASGTYTIVDAGTLTGAENLTSSIVTLPFLFNSSLASDAASGQVKLNVEMKSGDELGLNSSERSILDAAITAADADHPIAGVFLTAANSESLKSTLQQLMPDHSGGAFEAATKGSRLAAGFLSDPKPIGGVWIQQVLWGSSKGIGDTSSYKVEGWGANLGADHSIGALGSIGLLAGYYYGHDGKDNNELQSDHYEVGAYWRTGAGPLRAWARWTVGTISFKSVRNFSADLSGTTIARTATGKWNGRVYSASGGVSYEVHSGPFSFRPNVTLDYFRVHEKGYAETGGGDAFDLTVLSRNSNESAANIMLNIGYDIIRGDQNSGWMRVEAEGGRREILAGTLGTTVSAFTDGDLFSLAAEKRRSTWVGGARLLGGGPAFSVSAEANAQKLQGDTSLGGRMSLNLSL